MTAPETSIVIRARDEAKHIGRLLAGIQEQTYRDWEIIIVDSGSTDETESIASKYTSNICHIPPEDFTFGRSLNLGCQQAQGSYLVFASAHTYPLTNNWLGNLVKPFQDSQICMVYGGQRGGRTNSLSEEKDLLQIFGQTSKILIDEPLGNNGNAAIRRSLWLEGTFDETLTGLEDIDWAKRFQVRGYRIYYAADARIAHIHEESFLQVYRRYLREGLAYRRIFSRFRMSKQEAIKRLMYSVAADSLYALRHRKSLRKVMGILPYRTAEWVGKYRGSRNHNSLGRRLLPTLYNPKVSESVLIEAPGQHRLRQTEVPQAGTHEVLIQVAYVGVCATDLEVMRGSLEYYQRSYASYPITPGHEYSGVVVKVGDKVSNVHRGQKVVGECAIGCGECAACQGGEFYRCKGRAEVGVINMDGAYARYLKLPARYVHRLPDDISLREAPLVEPLAACIKGLRRLNVVSGREACVVGAGPVGNLMAQLLCHRGLGVTVVDPDERRLALLNKYDINTLIAPGGLEKFDYLIEASGNEAVIPMLIEGSKPSASILLLGLPYTRPISVAFSTVTGYDKEIVGSVASQGVDWEEAIRLLSQGAVRVDDHISVVLPLEQYNSAWELQEEKRHLKVLLAVNRELEWL